MIDKKDFRKKVEEKLSEAESYYGDTQVITGHTIFELIDQLDEQENIIIPDFVYKFIKKEKDRNLNNLWDIIQKLNNTHNQYLLEGYEHDVERWIFAIGKTTERQNLFIKAWFNYSDVRVEEKLYTVDLDGLLILAKCGEEADVESYHNSVESDDDYVKELTEKEIKNFDERYWAFAVEVEDNE